MIEININKFFCMYFFGVEKGYSLPGSLNLVTVTIKKKPADKAMTRTLLPEEIGLSWALGYTTTSLI
jgi:hypothetical protein